MCSGCTREEKQLQTMMGVPARSLEQRLRALERANEVRTRRARLKRELKAGTADLISVLRDPPDYVATAKVQELLLAAPRIGPVKANRITNRVRVSPSKTIGGMTVRQRAELLHELAA